MGYYLGYSRQNSQWEMLVGLEVYQNQFRRPISNPSGIADKLIASSESAFGKYDYGSEVGWH